MTNNILKGIIEAGRTCYFISPHFDDAILSAGALMMFLAKYTSVVVVNVFTQSDTPPYTISARSYLKQCGYSDAKKLYEDRKQEDANALKGIADKIINLDFMDALWRKQPKTHRLVNYIKKVIPEFTHIYPTYYFHIVKGKIAKNDAFTLVQLEKELTTQVADGFVFCPLGIGNHVDHLLVRAVCEKLSNPLFYWSDFPYSIRGDNTKLNIGDDSQLFTFNHDLEEKKVIIQKYQTQYNALFGNKDLTLEKEMYYTNYKIL